MAGATTETCVRWIIAAGLFLALSLAGHPSRANNDLVETGRLLAILLDSGRITIGVNQSLINDPDKGYKGFTPQVFREQLLETFHKRTGIDLHDMGRAPVPESAKLLLTQLIEESVKTVASYQPAINVAGVAYKGLIPATFATEAAARFRSWSGIYMKQTAPARLLRNPKNKPDEFEAMMLQKLEGRLFVSGEDKIVSHTQDEKSVRIFLPLLYSKECLSCHGEPKGERDMSGYPREGGKEGELGGAISVKIDLK